MTGPGQCGVAHSGAVLGRCGYGPRLPLLVVSPYARSNFVDHAVSDQSSILRFVEDNFSIGRIDSPPKSVANGGSFDQIAGTLNGMFDFDRNREGRDESNVLILDPSTGQPKDP